MIKIAHIKQIQTLQTSDLPKEAIDVVLDIATVLDNEYGYDRNVDGGNGGYILIIEHTQEFNKLKEVYIDMDVIIPEYVDLIKVEDGQDYTNTLLILGSDYTVSLIMPLSITPERFKRYMMED